MRAEVYPSPDGWRFRVRGNNNEIMATGEAYMRRIDAESALKQLFGNGQIDVAVRDHSTEVVKHYTLGRPYGSLDEVYGGQLDDVVKAHDEAEEAPE